MNFLFFFYLIGVLLAVFQDFARREIDDWLNLFLFFSGVLFLIVNDILLNGEVLILFGVFIFIISLLSFSFYYARFFSGGDSKLFFALSPIFFVPFFEFSLLYTLYFIFSLLLCGSVYSLIYSFILLFKDFRRCKLFLIKELKKRYSLVFFIFGAVLFFLGLFEKIFIFLSLFIFIFVFLFCFAKTLESVSMKRLVNTKDLREGDWLFSDVKIGKRTFRKSWDGLSEKDILYLKKYNKDVFIKDGIPYAPAFLFALILFVFRDYLLGIIF